MNDFLPEPSLMSSTPSVQPQSDLMAQLAALLSGQQKASEKPSSELVVPDYVSLWKKSLSESSKIIDLYGKWDKPPITKAEFAREIFRDLLERQRVRDSVPKS